MGGRREQEVLEQREGFRLADDRGRVGRRTIQQAEDGAKQRDGSLGLLGVGEQPGEMRAPQRWRSVVGEAGGAFEVAQRRIERAVTVVGRTLKTDCGMRLGGDAGKHRLAEPGFAEAGLAGQQEELAFSINRHGPAVEHKRQVGVAADKGSRTRVAGGAEAAGVVMSRDHPPGRNTGTEALQRQRGDRLQVEQIADERSGAGGDNNAIAGRGGL